MVPGRHGDQFASGARTLAALPACRLSHSLAQPMTAGRLPLWLKLVFSVWVVVWASAYTVMLGVQNFFWLCDLANFILLAGLWLESRRLVSMQLLSVSLVGILWTVDVVTALFTGVHPIGGTEYMFDPAHPAAARTLSLFHLMLPVVAIFAVARVGYDRRAIIWQTGLTWLVLPLTYVLTDPERNVNWVHGPFGRPQDSLDPAWYLAALMLLWPPLIYGPVHLLALALGRRASQRAGHEPPLP